MCFSPTQQYFNNLQAYQTLIHSNLEIIEPTFPLMEKYSKDQGSTGFTALVKDSAEKSETRFAQTTDFFNRFVFPLRGRSSA